MAMAVAAIGRMGLTRGFEAPGDMDDGKDADGQSSRFRVNLLLWLALGMISVQ
jgi:hypothetical protein